MAFAESGENIWFCGDSVAFFGVVSTGFVKMMREAPNGQEFPCEIIGPGQIFGMFCTIGGCGCPLTARAVCDTWYVRVPKTAFLPIFEESSPLKANVVSRSSILLREAYDMLARMTTGRVEERIAAVLLILAESYGTTTESGLRIDVPLTRQDIAEMAGVTVETAIRTLSKWRKDGLVLLEEATISALLRR